MRRASASLSLAAAALAALLITPSEVRAQSGCTIIITGTGQYKFEVRTGGPVPVVNFEKASGPVFSISRRGNLRRCDEALTGSIAVTKSRNASDLLFHIANELRAAAAVEWATSARPQLDGGYRDMAALAGAIRNDALVSGGRKIIADIAANLIKRYANPSSVLTDAGAKFVADTAVKLMIEHYLEGRDPGLIVDGLLNDMVAHLQGHAEKLAQSVGGDVLKKFVKDQLDSIAKEVKALLTEQLPDEEWMRAEASSAGCSFSLNVSYTPKNGRYRAVFSQRCGPQSDWIGSVVITAPTLRPGEAGQVTAQALSQLGTPFPLAGATITGLAAVMPDGSGEPAAAIAGNTATFNFTAAKPRRDTRYPIRVTLTTGASVGSLRGSGNDEVVVLNVAPRVDSVTPDSASAEPGETLELQRARVLVVDDNADRHNPGEVNARTLTIAHPAGLRTTPRFDRADGRRQVSFDPAGGTYVFEFSRSGDVERPHEHGTWSATLTIADDNGETADGAVQLEVEDVAPSVSLLRVTPQFVHTGDGKVIDITGRIEDANGAADIVDAIVDATAAGGQRYTLGATLLETGRGEEHIDVRIAAPFGHTDPEGRYPIPAEVRDEKNTGTDESFLNVGNEAPTSSATGFIHGPSTAGAEDVSASAPSELCPNDPFRVGMNASDPEGDGLIVTVTIVETGQTVTLALGSPNTYTADLRAPGQPGTYTLLFEAKEKPPGTKAATPVRHPLTVHPCDDRKEDILVGVALNPEGARVAVPDPAVQNMISVLDDLQPIPASGVGGALPEPLPMSSGPSADAAGEIWLAPLSASAADGQQPAGAVPSIRMFVTSLGTSTGEAFQVQIVNDGDRPVRLTPGSVVLEPIRGPAVETLQQQAQQLVGRANVATVTLTAYCLEFLRRPPSKGLMFRVAGKNLQQRFAPVRSVLDAAKRLQQAGLLRPDSDPAAYFHAIRQWAIWTREQSFDLKRFEEAFVERTKQNLEELGESWSGKVEREVRSRVAGRWQDIQRVLAEAAELENRRK